jgi:protein RecA
MAAKKPKRARPLEDAPASKGKKAPCPPRKGKEKPARLVVPKAKDYLRDLRAMKDVTREDFAFMNDPLAWLSTVEEWLSTGIVALDRLTGGGWPVGRIVELAAWESVGKSTILDQSIAAAQCAGAVCVLIDSEQARDEGYTASLGVKLNELIIHKAETIEQAYIGIDRVLAIQEAHIKRLGKKKQPPPMLIAWDSLAGTPTKSELEGAADDSHVAVAAKINKLNMRRMAQRLAHARATLIFANQFYQDIGPFASLKTYGGSGIRYHTSVRVWLTRTGALKLGSGDNAREVGHIVQAKLRKTRVNKPRPPAAMGLIWGAGVHNAYTLYEWGKTAGVDDKHRWVKTGHSGWSYLMLPDSEQYEAFQGKYLGFAEVLTQHPAVYEKMAEQYRAEG